MCKCTCLLTYRLGRYFAKSAVFLSQVIAWVILPFKVPKLHLSLLLSNVLFFLSLPAVISIWAWLQDRSHCICDVNGKGIKSIKIFVILKVKEFSWWVTLSLERTSTNCLTREWAPKWEKIYLIKRWCLLFFPFYCPVPLGPGGLWRHLSSIFLNSRAMITLLADSLSVCLR